MGKSKGGFYAVAHGRNPGIYRSWNECQEQTNQFSRPIFKKFDTKQDAQNYFEAHNQPSQQANPSSNYETDSYGSSQVYSNPYNYYQSYKKSDSKEEYTSVAEPPKRITPKATFNNKRKHSDDQCSNSQFIKREFDTNVSSSRYQKKEKSVVYTDGASSNNGRDYARAGYGVYWGDNDPRNVSARLDGKKQTNQRAEAAAVICALEQARGNKEQLEIMTDSMYVINGAEKWSKAWVKNEWRTSSGKEPDNVDMFQRIHKLTNERGENSVKFTYVPGHKGFEGNEKADRLAVAGARKSS